MEQLPNHYRISIVFKISLVQVKTERYPLHSNEVAYVVLVGCGTSRAEHVCGLWRGMRNWYAVSDSTTNGSLVGPMTGELEVYICNW